MVLVEMLGFTLIVDGYDCYSSHVLDDELLVNCLSVGRKEFRKWQVVSPFLERAAVAGRRRQTPVGRTRTF